MNAIAGRTETAALGAALATDWVSTSGIERTFLRSPAAPPGEDVGLTDPVGLTPSAISLPPLVPVVVNVVRSREQTRLRLVWCAQLRDRPHSRLLIVQPCDARLHGVGFTSQALAYGLSGPGGCPSLAHC